MKIRLVSGEWVEVEIGDRLTFKATTRDGRRKVTRKVTGFWDGDPCVTFNGWSEFRVGCFPGDQFHAVIPKL